MYDVYGYHDIRVGAGSGSSSALIQATVRATAAEHFPSLPEEAIPKIAARVEKGVDPLYLKQPAIVATRVQLNGPIRTFGSRAPDLTAVTWSAGSAVHTSSVKFEYNDNDLLLWRVRWASLERALRSADDARVARLASESARENQVRNPNADFNLLEGSIKQFGALGYSVAHTGSYHTALFPKTVDKERLHSFREWVLARSDGVHDREISIFNTSTAAERRFSL